MTIETKLFGEIAVDESKLISFPQGIIGFPELKDFLLIHDGDGNGNIKWMQSVQEPAFAMPVVDPLTVIPEYNPDIEDELLKPLGGITEENMLVIVTITVPKEIEKMTVNLKAPIIINSESRKAAQLIIDSDRYQVKFPIYEILKAAKEKAAAEKAGE
jgi:flagellar assembly factor FliW